MTQQQVPSNNPVVNLPILMSDLKKITGGSGWSFKSVEKIAAYALGLVSLNNPSGVMPKNIREIALAVAGIVVAAMHNNTTG